MNKEKTAIITGISGQDGSYLADFLLTKGYRVIGLTRDIGGQFSERIIHLKNQVELISTDYSRNSLDMIIKNIAPDEIYNMTGQTYVGKSWLMVDETLIASGIIPIHIIQSILECKSDIRLFQASSSEIYSPVDDTAIEEGAIILPSTPYGCSKSLAHQMVCAYRNNYNLFAVNGIFFSHESPRRGEDFLTKKVINGALDIKDGISNSLKLGALDIRRDWGHAKDFVEAAYLMLQQDQAKDYHICTNILHSVEELVDYIFSYLDLDYTKYVSSDTSLVRSIEPKAVRGCNRKIKDDIKWSPEITFEDMLIEMIKSEQVIRAVKGQQQ